MFDDGGRHLDEEDALVAMRRALDGVIPIGGCYGTLVLHRDGTAAACSEELDGRPCAGNDRPHAGIISCRDLLGFGGCEHCVVDHWDGRAWQHAAHVGVLAAGPRRCRRRPSPEAAWVPVEVARPNPPRGASGIDRRCTGRSPFER